MLFVVFVKIEIHLGKDNRDDPVIKYRPFCLMVFIHAFALNCRVKCSKKSLVTVEAEKTSLKESLSSVQEENEALRTKLQELER